MSLLNKASLIQIPSGYKDGTLYSAKPTNGDGDFTFSRGSNLAATRVNSDGLIEKGRENVVLYSEEFDNAAWVKTTDGQVTITANAAVAPDGTTTADKMIPSAIAGFHCVAQTITLSASITSISIFAKAAENSFLQIFDSLTTDFANFNLTTGEVASVDQYIATIENVGNGWYRCTASKANPSGNFTFRYGVVTSGTAVRGESFTGNGTDGLLIWGSQAELGLVATDYIPTTTTTAQAGILEDMPRLDYSGGSCPSLLLEPQRTNLVTHSEFYGGSDWGKTRCDIVTNTSDTLSPQGLYNASKMTSTDSSESYAQNDVVLGSTSGTYTFFAKKGDLDYCHALVWDRSANGRRQWFNLATGAVGTTTNFGSGYTKVDATIEDYGNGWYRCSFSWSGGNTTSGVRINISSGDGVIGSPVNSYGYFYGTQVEAGVSYPTSYIPTYGASVTRGVDSCSKTGISSLIGQTEGTLYSEFVVNGFTDFGTPLCINNGSTGESVWLTTFANGDIRAEVFSNAGGGIQASFLKSGNVTDQVYKIACAYAQNDFVFYVNGVQIGSDTSGSVPTGMNRIDFDYANATLFTKSALDINQALLFKTRLSNDELATLTTL